jgi:hypothetical protein
LARASSDSQLANSVALMISGVMVGIVIKRKKRRPATH